MCWYPKIADFGKPLVAAMDRLMEGGEVSASPLVGRLRTANW